jgi:cyanophycinase
LLIIGGREAKRHSPKILERFVALCRASERSPCIGVVTTASADAEAAFRTYREAFAPLGMAAQALDLAHRGQADLPEYAQALSAMAGVFFSGGDQLRITSTLGGTRFHRALLAQREQGLVIAGTSAGASMMSDVMIVGGADEREPARNTVRLAAGMGFWPGSVIDQHFSQRGRIGRLLAALAQNPEILAIGIDEDTAIELQARPPTFTVVGTNTVTVLDGRAITATNASESSPDQPLALVGVQLHVLAPGWGYDYQRRRPLSPAVESWLPF